MVGEKAQGTRGPLAGSVKAVRGGEIKTTSFGCVEGKNRELCFCTRYEIRTTFIINTQGVT